MTASPALLKRTTPRASDSVRIDAGEPLAPEAYRHNLSHSSVKLKLDAPHQVVLEYRGVWNFPECYQVGVIEGACRAFGADPRVRVRVLSPCDIDMLVRW